MIPHVIAGAAVGICIAGVGGYLYGRHDGREIAEGKQAAASLERAEVQRVTREVLATELSKITITNRTIVNKAEKEIVHEPVYRDCTHSDTMFQLLNYALSAGSSGQVPSDRVVPPTDSP